ncbi:MAG: hypothetical protein JRI71_08030 [Deltaproteobacteria bacterium]|nr:hypothetical protein [Deltaproteobacteria bacterium]
MPEFAQKIIGILFLIMVFVLTRIGLAHRIRRAATLVIKDLETRKAFDSGSAAQLPYAKQGYFRIGLRDYRPKALESLVQGGIVRRTENGKYYLLQRPELRNEVS